MNTTEALMRVVNMAGRHRYHEVVRQESSSDDGGSSNTSSVIYLLEGAQNVIAGLVISLNMKGYNRLKEFLVSSQTETSFN